MIKFLKATLMDGTEVISEFRNLEKVGKYIADVFSNRKPFNVWRTVSEDHPSGSGEACVVRTRMSIRPSQVRQITEVTRRTGALAAPPTSYEPQDFVDVQIIPKGERGLWRAPLENTPEGLVAGLQYPVHRDQTNFRDYVVVRTATIREEGITPEQKYYIRRAW